MCIRDRVDGSNPSHRRSAYPIGSLMLAAASLKIDTHSYFNYKGSKEIKKYIAKGSVRLNAAVFFGFGILQAFTLDQIGGEFVPLCGPLL